ncbi:MAG: heme-binding protein [Neomegalonema sp.]|nr:heme-binding protein [Neomegalonema sp.]
MDFEATERLTHAGAMKMLAAAIAKADETGQPQCIAIVDASGELIGEIRMTGAKFLSRKSALAKARTAASNAGPTANIPEEKAPLLARATGGEVTNLPGGLPIKKDGKLIGGIGVGSGTGEQDIAVAQAALTAVGADLLG